MIMFMFFVNIYENLVNDGNWFRSDWLMWSVFFCFGYVGLVVVLMKFIILKW